MSSKEDRNRLDYEGPPARTHEPAWFQALTLVGCILGLVIIVVAILDRFWPGLMEQLKHTLRRSLP